MNTTTERDGIQFHDPESLYEKGIGAVCWSKRVEALLRLGHRFVHQYAPSPRLASTRLSGAAIAKPFFKQALRSGEGRLLGPRKFQRIHPHFFALSERASATKLRL